MSCYIYKKKIHSHNTHRQTFYFLLFSFSIVGCLKFIALVSCIHTNQRQPTVAFYSPEIAGLGVNRVIDVTIKLLFTREICGWL